MNMSKNDKISIEAILDDQSKSPQKVHLFVLEAFEVSLPEENWKCKSQKPLIILVDIILRLSKLNKASKREIEVKRKKGR